MKLIRWLVSLFATRAPVVLPAPRSPLQRLRIAAEALSALNACRPHVPADMPGLDDARARLIAELGIALQEYVTEADRPEVGQFVALARECRPGLLSDGDLKRLR